MSLKNLLDLRKKVSPQVQIVEKIILKKRSWKTEVLRTFFVIITASAVIWGISNADTLLTPTSSIESKNFSAIGIISNIATSTLSIQNAKGSDGKSEYTFDTDSVTKIETKSYVPLTLSDIHTGDRVVVQGIDDQGNISIKRIISFSVTSSKEKEVATTTPEVATTTDSTSTASTTASTSPSLIDTIKDVVSNVVDVITGTTSTSTEDISTTTASTTDEVATSIQVATTTEASSTSTSSPSLIEKVTDAVTDTINTVVNAITGTTSSTDTPPASDPLPAPVDNSTN